MSAYSSMSRVRLPCKAVQRMHCCILCNGAVLRDSHKHTPTAQAPKSDMQISCAVVLCRPMQLCSPACHIVFSEIESSSLLLIELIIPCCVGHHRHLYQQQPDPPPNHKQSCPQAAPIHLQHHKQQLDLLHLLQQLPYIPLT